MFNLLKKDLICCFKVDTKTILKLIIGIFLISITLIPSIFTPLSTVTLTFFLSYIFIFRSFYLDELNKCDYFFNSMPIEKDDVVYSKYLFATVIIIGSLLLSYFCSKIANNILEYRNFNMDVVLISLILVLLFISITFPLTFKYGYRKSYIILNMIIAVVVMMGIFGTQNMQTFMMGEWEKAPILIDKTLIVKLILVIIMYLVSMYISKKIYNKKEIAQ